MTLQLRYLWYICVTYRIFVIILFHFIFITLQLRYLYLQYSYLFSMTLEFRYILAHLNHLRKFGYNISFSYVRLYPKIIKK